MLKKRGFSNKIYFKHQIKKILERLNDFDKLYLEIGGKLLYDGHASRVLPGFKPQDKIELLKKLKNLEIIYCVSAKDIASSRHLEDTGFNYKIQTLNDLKKIKQKGFKKVHVCITRYSNEKEAKDFRSELEKKDYPVYFHYEIKGYPKDLNKAISGYSKQDFIKTNSKLVIVTGAAGGSGKMAVAMAQIYNETRKHKTNVGYSKYELFPIWNLPLNHPINVAYEAATADLGDYNVIDPYYLKKYHKKAVNYNRDVSNFAILKKLFQKIISKNGFKFYSPTEMGVNMAKEGIINKEVCKKAAINEIKRRRKYYESEFKAGRENKNTIKRMKEIYKLVGLKW